MIEIQYVNAPALSVTLSHIFSNFVNVTSSKRFMFLDEANLPWQKITIYTTRVLSIFTQCRSFINQKSFSSYPFV